MTEHLPKDSPSAFGVRILGIVPHASQAEFLECRATTKVACCGRRWGKSTACAIDALWFAMTRPASDQFIVAPTADQARIIWDQARRLAEEGLLRELVSRAVESPFPELRLVTRDASGAEVESTIAARSVGHDAKYLRGHGADRVIADEAAFLPDPVLTQVIPPMLASSAHGELVLISTPFGAGNTFHRLYQEGQMASETIRSFHYPSSANPRLSRAYLDQQRAQMTQLAYETEYEALFLDSQASVFRREVIEAAIDDTITPGPLEGHRYVIGYDPAKYSDRSAVAVLDVTEKPYRLVEILDIAGREYLVQAGIIRELAQRYHRARVLLDATSHDQMLEELKRSAVHASGLRFTNEVKRELIDGLALALERRDVAIPRHPDLIRELSYYRFETTPAGHVKLGARQIRGAPLLRVRQRQHPASARVRDGHAHRLDGVENHALKDP